MSEESSQLSVVIPTWNALGLTSRAVEHLNRDGYPDWAELIVVNDGSDDGTSTHLRTLFPRLTVIDHATNRGFGAAVNTGFAAARGQFLGTLNNDALVTWSELRHLVKFLESRTDAAAVAPLICDRDGHPQRVGFDLPQAPWSRIAPWRVPRDQIAASRPASVKTPYRVGYLRGACVVFNRPALEEVGLFDEQFHMFAEEIDLFHRLSVAGWTAWVVPTVEATHLASMTTRNHPDPVLAAGFRLRSYRSMCIYYQKHNAWATAAVLRAVLAARISERLLRSLISTRPPWHAPRGVREQLGYLAVVLRPSASSPIEPSLTSRQVHEKRLF